MVSWRDPGGSFVGSSLELPTVFGSGETEAKCLEVTRQLLVLTVEAMINAGERPPISGRRTAQVNLRFKPEEKTILAEKARELGLSTADLIRFAALERVSCSA